MSTFWSRMRDIISGTGTDEQEIGSLGVEEPVQVEEYGSTVELRYSGVLSQSGRPIYVHFGRGPGAWSDVGETAMQQVANGLYQAEIGVAGGEGELEFCFRNDRGEWDNNGGENWSYPLL